MFVIEDFIFQASKLACCTRFPGVKIRFRFWSIDGARLECRQKYFDTNKNKEYALRQLLFHVEIPCTSWVFLTSQSLGFYDGEVRSNLPFLKSAETVFLLAAGTVTFKWFI